MQLHTCEYRPSGFPNPVICAFMQPIADRLGSGLNPYHRKNLGQKNILCEFKVAKRRWGEGGEGCISACGSCIRVCVHKAYYLFEHALHRSYPGTLVESDNPPVFSITTQTFIYDNFTIYHPKFNFRVGFFFLSTFDLRAEYRSTFLAGGYSFRYCIQTWKLCLLRCFVNSSSSTEKKMRP